MSNTISRLSRLSRCVLQNEILPTKFMNAGIIYIHCFFFHNSVKFMFIMFYVISWLILNYFKEEMIILDLWTVPVC